MGFANRAFVAGGLGFAVSALVACGSSGSLLSVDQANSLENQLGQVSAEVAGNQCVAAQRAIAGLQNTLAGFSSVDQTLVNNLNQGVETIAQLAQVQCRSSPVSTPSTTTSKQKTTTTSTATTTTTSTPATTTTPVSTITTATNTSPSGGVGLPGSTSPGTTSTPSAGSGGGATGGAGG